MTAISGWLMLPTKSVESSSMKPTRTTSTDVSWVVAAPDPATVDRIKNEAGVSALIAGLLASRGVRTGEEAHQFLHPSISHLHSPFSMLGMKAALERLRAAIERKEQVLIYGDYDVDGTTAVVVLKTAIELCGGGATYHVPHRIREGYGMKDDVVEQAAADGVRLIISVDTGIRAFAAAEAARRAGVDLIVTDHHLPQEQGVPAAVAVLNPNQDGCAYPCKALCGAGVAFKLAQALLEESGRGRLLPSFMKMVAIATIADAVPLTGENRVIASIGLEGLRSPVNAGLRALVEVAQLESGRKLTASDIGFRLAPRLNAAGRMDVAQCVIELFCEKDAARAHEIAARLNQLNADRQFEESRIMSEIDERLKNDAALRDAWCMVIDGAGWHRGVIGICATRVVERYGRPALVLAIEGDEAHGSGRSIRAFHLLEAIESCAHLFTRFGGHAHAVGFALPAEKVAELRAAVDGCARARLTPADFVHPTEVDAEITLDAITPELFRELERLQPFGMENPEPVFGARGVKILLPPRLLKEKHIKLRIGESDGNGRVTRAIDALGWRMAERTQQEPLLQGDHIDVSFTVERNQSPDFGGGLQLKLCDFQKARVAVAG
jgi:single-stranded-DNA-specific exonuclease